MCVSCNMCVNVRVCVSCNMCVNVWMCVCYVTCVWMCVCVSWNMECMECMCCHVWGVTWCVSVFHANFMCVCVSCHTEHTRVILCGVCCMSVCQPLWSTCHVRRTPTSYPLKSLLVLPKYFLLRNNTYIFLCAGTEGDLTQCMNMCFTRQAAGHAHKCANARNVHIHTSSNYTQRIPNKNTHTHKCANARMLTHTHPQVACTQQIPNENACMES